MRIFSSIILLLFIGAGISCFSVGFRACFAGRPLFFSQRFSGILFSIMFLNVIPMMIEAFLAPMLSISPDDRYLFFGIGFLISIPYACSQCLMGIFYVITPLALIGKIDPQFELLSVFLMPYSFSVFPVIVFVLVTTYMWFQSKAYLVTTVTSESFLQALRHTFEKMNLEYEQPNNYDFHIKSMKADLIVDFRDSFKTAGIGFKKKTLDRNAFLDRIVEELKHYYRNEDFKYNYRVLIIYLIFGAFLIAAGVGLYAYISLMAAQIK